MNSEMTIGKKLYLAFGFALAITLAACLGSWYSTSRLGAAIDKLIAVNARKLALSGEINTSSADIVGLERGVLLRAYLKDPATIDQYQQDFHRNLARTKQDLDEYLTLVETEEGRQMLFNLQNIQANIARQGDEMYRLASNGQLDEATKLDENTVKPLTIEASAEGERLAKHENEVMSKSAHAAVSVVTQSRWAIGILILLGLCVGAGVLLIVQNTNKVLNQIVHELSAGAEQVASASAQIASASQALAQGASEQAASLEETSSSTEEITSMTNQNADNSKTAAESMVSTAGKITEGNHKLDEMVASMKEITDSSEKISKIIKTIDEIAFQTNILALNAAVEAARAGEAGMGFAVVADEVRNLAQRCTVAAKDTAALIEDSIHKTQDGGRKLDEVSKSISGATAETEKVKTLVDEVSVGSQEQARGLQQIAGAITQMEQVTQKTAASSEQSAAAAEELTAQSESLRAIIVRLTSLVGGGAEQDTPGFEPGPLAISSQPRRRASEARPLSARHLATRATSLPAFQPKRDFLSDGFQEM